VDIKALVALLDWLKRKKAEPPSPEAVRAAAERIKTKYDNFQRILSLNTECLELIAGLQEDLQFIPPRRDVVQERVGAIFERAEGIAATLGAMTTGAADTRLVEALSNQRFEVERHIAALQELEEPRLSAWLSEVGLNELNEVGGKAAYLGEVKNRIGLPVPQGYVLTTEAYLRFCGIPCWEAIRDATRAVELDKLETLTEASNNLQELILHTTLPRAVEVALTARAEALRTGDRGLAVRSSAVGEGGEKTYAGQFLTLLNVPPGEVAEAYRHVIAARFSERALSYRISSGLFEVSTPLAVLVLPIVQAAASGIMYTRDPSNRKSKELWITSTRGLGLDIASGHTPADLFVVSRKRGHQLVREHLADKLQVAVAKPGGGIQRNELSQLEARESSLTAAQMAKLADYGMAIEDYFRAPQDVEWAVDEAGEIWILQTRPLAVVEAIRGRSRAKVSGPTLASEGVTVFPGRVSGPAHVVTELDELRDTPEGAILVLSRVSPEIVPVLPRISGLVSEWGNVAAHAAALLREYKIPSVFMMKGLLEAVSEGDAVSLDAVQRKLYPGTHWSGRQVEISEDDTGSSGELDPINRHILALNLVDPSAYGFRPSACKSTHDVLRFCHEKSVEAMFTANDYEMEQAGYGARKIKTDVPMNLCVLDLGGGVEELEPTATTVDPQQVISRPFQSLWKGITHPGVSWRRDIPASFSDVASVMAQSFTPGAYDMRALGMKSYLLLASEYMNLNSRLAYHFTLVDACLCEDEIRNYISFRFAGGGATRFRRNLRAQFLARCLSHYGFLVHRRGDLVNAWLRNVPESDADYALNIMGRLIACTSQLDMYMANPETMNWFADQFLAENYSFTEQKPSADAEQGSS
jgi:pyruvate, water dikinase